MKFSHFKLSPWENFLLFSSQAFSFSDFLFSPSCDCQDKWFVTVGKSCGGKVVAELGAFAFELKFDFYYFVRTV